MQVKIVAIVQQQQRLLWLVTVHVGWLFAEHFFIIQTNKMQYNNFSINLHSSSSNTTSTCAVLFVTEKFSL